MEKATSCSLHSACYKALAFCWGRDREVAVCSVCREIKRDCSPEGLWARGSLKLYLPSIGTSGVAGMDGDLKPSMLQVSMVCRAAFRVN